MGYYDALNSKFPDGLTRREATAFYVIYQLERLKKEGVVEGGFCEITKKGERIWKKLQSIGFKPELSEMMECLATMTDPASAEKLRRALEEED